MTEATVEAVRHRVVVVVNRREVQLQGARHSGLEVKEAAIAQGVAIQIGFQLSIRKPNGKFRVVGDDEILKLEDGDTFRAVTGDDNS